MQDHAVFGQGDIARGVHGAPDVLAVNIPRAVPQRDTATAVDAADVASRDADNGALHRHAGNTFRFFESWESQELLDSHLAAPHEIAFGERNLQRITGATASFFEASPTAPVGVPAPG